MQPNGQASERLRTVLRALEFNELRVLPESVMMAYRTFAELKKVVGFRYDKLKQKKEAECIKLRQKEAEKAPQSSLRYAPSFATGACPPATGGHPYTVTSLAKFLGLTIKRQGQGEQAATRLLTRGGRKPRTLGRRKADSSH